MVFEEWFNMDGAILILVGVLVVSILMWVLLPVFTEFINNAGLNALNVSGTVKDYSWAGTVFVIIYILAAALLPIGVLTYVIYAFVKKHK